MVGVFMGNLRADAIRTFTTSKGREVSYYSISALGGFGIGRISELPFSMRIVLEALLRNCDGKEVLEEEVVAVAKWGEMKPYNGDLHIKVSRILMQDFTGVPAVVDLAALREYLKEKGLNPSLINPIIPVDLIIDHSVQVDSYAKEDSVEINQAMEMSRNSERYSLLKWASSAFSQFRVVPPSGGICHQVNLENIATCVTFREKDGKLIAFPDSLVGTDSHTTMINGLGVFGFGVGGIEAEAALLDQPISLPMPEVVGVKLTGRLNPRVTAMDLALTLTKRLRELGVVGKFVEFFGDGVKALSLPDRATISNMCPEYGATVSIFPVDEETLRYMKSTGRTDEQIDLIRSYYTAQSMFPINYADVKYNKVIEVRLDEIEPSVSGPSQPKQEIRLGSIADTFYQNFMAGASAAPQEQNSSQKDYARWSQESTSVQEAKAPAQGRNSPKESRIRYDDGSEEPIRDGDVVIAAITSCTNTSNPTAMIGAGILARNAVNRGLVVSRKVKTSFAPGSRVVSDYLVKSGLYEYMERLGFSLVGFGCTTCIGNSGPLPPEVSKSIKEDGIVTASVLSGNRNYEARIHTEVRANYLMSPPLVVAFAIAGSVLKDITKEPLGRGSDGKDVYLDDIWPDADEIRKIAGSSIDVSMFNEEYKRIFSVNKYWDELSVAEEETYPWNAKSTYINLPPFFAGFDYKAKHSISDIKNARVLAVFGDSLSTDHISPAGAIPQDSPAGKYLIEHGVERKNFNTYGSRRGNHEVMMRGTFANVRIKNLLLNGEEGGYTLHFPDKSRVPIYDAAMNYAKEGVPLVVIGGKEYGSGSSRDWAAKGPALLGVKAVIAKSFERIHRSNLAGMGIVPIEFPADKDFASLGIDPEKPISIGISDALKPNGEVNVSYTSKSGKEASFIGMVRLESELEVEYCRVGGVLNYVLRRIVLEAERDG